jgi:AcrR family transcriptional regulator
MARPEDPTARSRILRTATALFYARGVRAVGMSEVIEAAGCGKNVLYRHFPSKSALTAAYLTEIRAERDRATAAALTDPDPAARLIALVTEVAQWTRRRDYRGCAFRNFLTEFPTADDEPARVARAYLTDTRREIDTLVTELGRPPLLAVRLWLLIEALYATRGTGADTAVDWARELVTA